MSEDRNPLVRHPDTTVLVIDAAGHVVGATNPDALDRSADELIGLDVARELWAHLPWAEDDDPETVTVPWQDPRTGNAFAVDLFHLRSAAPDGPAGIAIVRAGDSVAHGLARAVYEEGADGILIVDDERRYVEVNPAACRLLRRSREELLGLSIPDLMVEGADETWERFAEDGSATGVAALYRGDGTTVIVDFRAKANIVPGRHLSLIRDATTRLRLEGQLRESEARFRTMIEFAGDGVWRLDREHRLVYVNPRMAELVGRTEAELLGRVATDLVADEARADLVAHLEACAEGRRDRRELLLRRRDGEPLPAIVSSTPLTLEDGRPAGSMATVTDLTGRVAAERRRRQLQDAQRLDGLGRLAGGIAHDFNNLIGVILNFSEFLHTDLEGRDDLRGDVAQIRMAAERAAELTQRLLTLGGRGFVTPETFDLREVLDAVDELLAPIIAEAVDLQVHVPSTACHVHADRRQLEQLVLSLAINAAEAMPDGGTLAITIEPPADGHVVLRVADTGHGMLAEVRERAFEPFFTTRGGENRGLGLASVLGIAGDCGGSVELDSRPDGGTTVVVRLPVADPVRRERTAPARPPGRVLVVDDEPAVRTLAVRLLERAGYQVDAHADADAALAAYDTAEPPYAAVVTDLVLPGQSGAQLAARLRELDPDQPIVFMSGYTDEAAAHEAVRGATVTFVAKPFTGQQLVDAVGESLQRRQP